ncbi:hypothetical protein EUGRSUZ_K01711 [Eucalyptus grandis]|uniref:Uncharacterized protein n=2 Tax=Eucalyptus grandis TaxID=71139 RepID=A0ACC3IVE6_EUCGR|nr:hypothetical protein EUGRSUZ_K01711 [Eucalyptus grandis]
MAFIRWQGPWTNTIGETPLRWLRFRAGSSSFEAKAARGGDSSNNQRRDLMVRSWYSVTATTAAWLQ